MKMIIVGGGMAGATLALAVSALSAGRIQVEVVEAVSPDSRQHPGFDARAIALAYGTCQQLERIGVWQALKACATPIERVHVSDQGHAGFVGLDALDYQIPYLGQVVELHQAGSRLFQLLEKAPGVTLHCPAKVVGVERQKDSARIALDNGSHLTGELLVAADGSRSAIATQCGVEWRSEPYGQVAVIANVSTAGAHKPLSALPVMVR